MRERAEIEKIVTDACAATIEAEMKMDDRIEDSLDHVEVVMAVEEALGIEVDDEVAETLTTPRMIVEYLVRRGA